MNDQIDDANAGVVRGIAQRAARRAPMEEVSEVTIEVDKGIAPEDRPPGRREVTFLAVEAWAATCKDLGRELPWHTRRANILVDGLDLVQSIGKTIAVGGAKVLIHAETRPCQLMEELSPGLRQAMVPDGRGGVYGQVVVSGPVRVGDTVRILDKD